MKIKIIIATLLMFLLIGVTFAIDINDLKVPDGWESIGDGKYHEIGASTGSGSGRNLMIQSWTDDLKEEYLNNFTEDHYYVYSNNDNTFNYTDGVNNDYGCFEMVKIDDEEYFILFSTLNDYEGSDDRTTYDILSEFNKLNGLEPVEI